MVLPKTSITRVSKVAPNLVASHSVSFSVDPKGVLHQPLPHTSACQRGNTALSLTLEDAKKKEFCGLCLRSYRMHTIKVVGPLIGAVNGAVAALERGKKFLDKAPADTNTTLILREVTKSKGEYKHFIDSIQKLRSTPGVTVSPSDWASIENFRKNFEEKILELQNYLKSDSVRDKTLSEIRITMFGFDIGEAALNSSPTITAIASFNPENWLKPVGMLIQQFKISSNPLVLKVPKYVANYLLYASPSGLVGWTEGVDVDGLDDTVIDTAVQLWTPGVEGPMASLYACVQAAKSV